MEFLSLSTKPNPNSDRSHGAATEDGIPAKRTQLEATTQVTLSFRQLLGTFSFKTAHLLLLASYTRGRVAVQNGKSFFFFSVYSLVPFAFRNVNELPIQSIDG